MSRSDILVVAGAVAALALFVGLGVWWQLWMTRRIGRWGAGRYSSLDPAARDRIEPQVRRVPGGKKFLGSVTPESVDEGSPKQSE